MIVLDTDVAIDFLRGESYAVDAVTSWIHSGERLATTSINAGELFRGARGSDRGAEALVDVAQLLGLLDELPYDAVAARRFGEVMAALDKAGRRMPASDGMIAAVALVNGGRFATRNGKRFARVPGLELVLKER